MSRSDRRSPFGDKSGTTSSMRPGFSAVVAALVLEECFPAPEFNEVPHPTPENAPPVTAVPIRQDTLPLGMSHEALRNWSSVRDELIDARTVLQIGAKYTDGPDAFGDITDVAVSTSGDVFVLDGQAQEVRIFDANGNYVESIGGIGDGPTEFRYANRIALLSDGRLAVSSRGPQIKIFRSFDGIRRVDEIVRAPAFSRDICFTNSGRVFAAGYKRSNNTLVHEIADTVEGVLQDFGDGYRDDHWLVQMHMGNGVIECINTPRTVAFAFRGIPILRAHEVDDGSVAWSAWLEDFVVEPVFEGVRKTGEPYVRYGETDQWDVIGDVHNIRPGYLLLQTGRFNWLEKTVVIRSYLIDARNGRGAFIANTLPRIFPAPNGHVAVFDDPYPRLEIRIPRNKEI